MQAMRELSDFEIHVAFPRDLTGLRKRLDPEKEHWNRVNVSEVVTGPASQGSCNGHDVPGVLTWMSTKRVNDFEVAVSEVGRLARLYHDSDNIRIELEQVLMTDDGSHPVVLPATRRTPLASDFGAGKLVANTPPFETHFSIVTGRTNDPVRAKTWELIELAESIGLPVHQAVRFAGTGKVIVTTFFEDFREMVAETKRLTPDYRRALAARELTLKVVSERIISCVQPQLQQTARPVTAAGSRK